MTYWPYPQIIMVCVGRQSKQNKIRSATVEGCIRRTLTGLMKLTKEQGGREEGSGWEVPLERLGLGLAT